ncbi:MAG: hypothetical protein RR338_03295 [Clostridia bacterium]
MSRNCKFRMLDEENYNGLKSEKDFIETVKKGVEQRIREYANCDKMYSRHSGNLCKTDDVVEYTNNWIDDNLMDSGCVEDEYEACNEAEFEEKVKVAVDGVVEDMGQDDAIIDAMSVADYEELFGSEEEEEEAEAEEEARLAVEEDENKIKRLTRREVNARFGGCHNTDLSKVYCACAYIYEGKVGTCVLEHGDGMPELLYNGTTDAYVDLMSIKDSNDGHLKDFVEGIQEAINEMIDDYNKAEATRR